MSWDSIDTKFDVAVSVNTQDNRRIVWALFGVAYAIFGGLTAIATALNGIAKNLKKE